MLDNELLNDDEVNFESDNESGYQSDENYESDTESELIVDYSSESDSEFEYGELENDDLNQDIPVNDYEDEIDPLWIENQIYGDVYF